jgi:hypothetical protein
MVASRHRRHTQQEREGINSSSRSTCAPAIRLPERKEEKNRERLCIPHL